MILDTILVTQDPADAAVTEGGTTRLTRTDQQAVQPGPRADDDGNLVLNPSFEVGTTQGWHAAYQSQWALTEEHYDEDRPFDGERCLHLDLMRNRRAPLVQVWQVCGGLASAPFRVAEGERYTQKANPQTRKSGSQDCTATPSEHQPERADHFGGRSFYKRHQRLLCFAQRARLIRVCEAARVPCRDRKQEDRREKLRANPATSSAEDSLVKRCAAEGIPSESLIPRECSHKIAQTQCLGGYLITF